MNFERRLSKDDREIYISLKPFARFFSQAEFNELYEGLVLEKNLRQRLNQLKAYQDINLKTYEEIENFLENDSRKNKDEKKISAQLDATFGLKLDKELNAANEEHTQSEKEYIKRNNINAALYNEIKVRLSGKDSRNSIKSTLTPKYNCTKEEVDQIADYVVKLKK